MPLTDNKYVNIRNEAHASYNLFYTRTIELEKSSSLLLLSLKL